LAIHHVCVSVPARTTAQLLPVLGLPNLQLSNALPATKIRLFLKQNTNFFKKTTRIGNTDYTKHIDTTDARLAFFENK
jgi:hypothetical protein